MRSRADELTIADCHLAIGGGAAGVCCVQARGRSLPAGRGTDDARDCVGASSRQRPSLCAGRARAEHRPQSAIANRESDIVP